MSIQDEARTEAERQWPMDVDGMRGRQSREDRELMRHGFEYGYIAASQREPTVAEVEAAAKALYEADPVWSYAREEYIPWDDPDPAWFSQEFWRIKARAALLAARNVKEEQ